MIPVWLTGQGREGLTIWSRGGATHLSSARKTWQVTAIVIIITMIANKIINKATKEPFKRNRSTEEKQGMCPAMWSLIENVWLDCKQISLLNYLEIYLCNLRRCSNHAGLLPVMIFYEAKSIVRALPKQRAGLLCLMMQKRGQAIIRVLCDRVLGPPILQNKKKLTWLQEKFGHKWWLLMGERALIMDRQSKRQSWLQVGHQSFQGHSSWSEEP